MGTMECIMAIPGNDKKAYCRYSKSEMRVYHGDLVSHAKTKKH